MYASNASRRCGGASSRFTAMNSALTCFVSSSTNARILTSAFKWMAPCCLSQHLCPLLQQHADLPRLLHQEIHHHPRPRREVAAGRIDDLYRHALRWVVLQ